MSKPLEVLRKGLKALRKQVKTRREKLQGLLAARKKISPQDEEWLDNEGNLVVEEQIVENLDHASDYERAVNALTAEQQEIVTKLRELAGDLPKTVGNKRKRE